MVYYLRRLKLLPITQIASRLRANLLSISLKGPIMTPEQIQALSAMTSTPEVRESKTIDYKVSMTNKKKIIRSVGIFKVWKRFSPEQIDGIVALLGGSSRVTIELLTGESVESDDEF